MEPSDLELTPGEIAAVKRSAATRGVGDLACRVPLREVPGVFGELGFTVSAPLIEALATEYVSDPTDPIDVDTLLRMLADWKALQRMQLREVPGPISNEEFKRLTGRNLLVPDSLGRTAWSYFVMLCGLTHWVCVLARDADDGFSRPVRPTFVVLDWVFTIVYTVDILLWFHTLKFVTEGVVDSAEEVRMLHLRSPWLWLDVASTVPLDVILSLAGAPVASAAFNHLRLIRYPRSLAFFTRTYELALTPHRIVVFFMALPMWFLLYFAAGLVTALALVHALVSHAGGNPDIRFLQSVYYVVQTCTTVGYGDPTLRPKTTGEIYFGVFLVYFGLLTNAVGIGRLVTQLQRSNAYSTREDKLRETLAVLKYFHIPHDLQTEILSFQEHVLWNDTANAYFNETQMLPQAMRDTMLLQTRIDVLTHVPLLRDAPPPVLVHLAGALLSTCYKPEEYISFSGDPHAGLRFVLFGFVVRFDSRGEYVKVLKPGEYFGFDGCLTRADEEFSHKALSYCDIWVLQISKLHEVLDKYPRFYERFKAALPLKESEREFLRANDLSSLPNADEGLYSDMDPQALLVGLKHLRWRLEQAATRKGFK